MLPNLRSTQAGAGEANQSGAETASLVRVNPIVPQPGAVKPLYLEFIRAKERGLVGKEVTWKEYQIDGHQGETKE